MITTKERPILFSAPMVRAILDGTKTQTRRIGKCQNDAATELAVEYSLHATKGMQAVATCAAFPGKGSARWGLCVCPYGIPGDRLWVRESYYQFGNWEKIDGIKTKTGRQKWKFVPHDSFNAKFDRPDGSVRLGRHHKDPHTSAWHKRLARFMPRALSRTNLEILSVRVERLQDISEAESSREGLNYNSSRLGPWSFPGGKDWMTAKDAFRELWESINGSGSFAENPYVWVVAFKRIKP